ncbi:acetyl-CoA carboxylase biotin carboxyl carrier protein [Salinispora arenicola]|uniref:acetyl-CoA carboxylase biotin carboxyl carrier protein n=1 Tax=Salinispora arenicola TaxID=168697 RepID=UPI0003AB2918|nr:acetyl-CoA carboxylase biotin carboxyl carrier protein [Salinispora arenicola]
MNDQETSLDQLRRTAAALLELSPHPPSGLRLRTGDLSLEVDWAQSAGPAGAPVAAAIAPAAATNAVAVAAAPAAGDAVAAVRAPLLGTFYRAPAPEAPPFVALGDRVEVGQQIGIVESMKLMNPVESDVAGEVVEVVVADGTPVEYDQVLLMVATDRAADGCAELFGGREPS